MRRRLPFLALAAALGTIGILLYLQAVQVPAEPARTIHVVFNYVEPLVWAIAGGLVFWRSRRQSRARRSLGIVSAVTLLAFGVSDLVETSTGTWWEPWWLLAWKAVCVLILLLCLQRYGEIPDEGAV